jgi:hypothetical protein
MSVQALLSNNPAASGWPEPTGGLSVQEVMVQCVSKRQ